METEFQPVPIDDAPPSEENAVDVPEDDAADEPEADAPVEPDENPEGDEPEPEPASV